MTRNKYVHGLPFDLPRAGFQASPELPEPSWTHVRDSSEVLHVHYTLDGRVPRDSQELDRIASYYAF